MLGSFGEVVFYVNSFDSFTFKNFSETHGSNFADHNLIEGKPRKQFIGAKNTSITFDVELRVDDSLIKNLAKTALNFFNSQTAQTPRNSLERFKELCSKGEAKYLIIGGRPVSQNPFIITGISDKWNVILNHGQLYSCSVSLTLEEYVSSL